MTNILHDAKVKFMKKYSDRILYAMPYKLLAMKIPVRVTIEPTNFCLRQRHGEKISSIMSSAKAKS